MATPEIFDHFSTKLEMNFYILPSSIHETILIPDDSTKMVDYKHLKEMVKEVNETQVDEVERLSDHVYYYDRKAKEISIVA